MRDAARIEHVVAKIRAAARAGLSEAIAEPVWRTPIEPCIGYGREVLDSLRAQARAGDLSD